MKKCALLPLILCALGGPAHAQAPVIDVASITQQVKSLNQDLQAFARQGEQLQTARQSFQTLQAELTNFMHNPTLGAALGLMNQAGLQNPLPLNPQSLQSVLTGQGGFSGMLGSLSTLANTAYTANHLYSPTDGTDASKQIIANGYTIANAQAMAMQAVQDVQTHLPVLAALRDRLNTATTTKDVLDASAQVQVEQAWANHAVIELHAANLAYQTAAAARTQHADEQITQDIDQFLSQGKGQGVGGGP